MALPLHPPRPLPPPPPPPFLPFLHLKEVSAGPLPTNGALDLAAEPISPEERLCRRGEEEREAQGDEAKEEEGEGAAERRPWRWRPSSGVFKSPAGWHVGEEPA